MKNSFVKTLSVCLCLVMLLPVCGCQNEGTEALWDEAKYVEENSSISAFGDVDAVCCDGVLYYCWSVPYLYYAAIDGSEAGPLCSKPECTHRSVDCAAHTNIIIKAQLMMYKGRLFWLEGNAGGYNLVSAEPGSGDRRTEQRYELSFWRSHSGCYSTISNGVLYLAGKGIEVHDGKPNESVFIYAQDLENGNMELVYELVIEGLEANCLAKRWGDTIYIAITNNDLCILAFDMSTREVREIVSLNDVGGYSDMVIEKGRILLRGENCIRAVDPAAGDSEVIYRGEGVFLFNDKAVLTIADMAHFRCYDYDNNLIGEWGFDEAGLMFTEAIKFPLGCVDGKLFFRVQPMTEDPNMGYLISCVPEENRFEVVQAIPRG